MTQAAKLAQLGSPGISTGFKNRIINGAMVIDQRNAGASVTNVATDTYTLDRWQYSSAVASKFTIQQNAGSVTPPAGFTNYLGITSTSAYSVTSGDYSVFSQVIEGLNVADLGWGTANAATVTLSFKVYSSLTGTFGGSIQNGVNDRSYPFTYTISSANTWTNISITVAGDTSGSWLTTNGRGMYVRFQLCVGSTYTGTAGAWAGANYFGATGATNVLGTNGATLYITGVQLEVGTTATDFEYRDYGRELMMCQRYYYQHVSGTSQTIGIGIMYNSTLMVTTVQFPATMRTVPSLVSSNNTNNFLFYRNSASDGFDLFTSMNEASTTCANIRNDNQVSGTAGQAGFVIADQSTARLAFNSEL